VARRLWLLPGPPDIWAMCSSSTGGVSFSV
jgi:hypothetical protein